MRVSEDEVAQVMMIFASRFMDARKKFRGKQKRT